MSPGVFPPQGDPPSPQCPRQTCEQQKGPRRLCVSDDHVSEADGGGKADVEDALGIGSIIDLQAVALLLPHQRIDMGGLPTGFCCHLWGGGDGQLACGWHGQGYVCSRYYV